MVRVAVTGAAGSVGREALRSLKENGHDVMAITHREHDDIKSTIADVTDYEAHVEAFRDREVVVHLAAAADGSATWESVLQANIDGTQNIYEAAREADVERVVFASSNHTTGMYNIAEPDERGTMTLDHAEIVTPKDPPRPDGFYGVSKVAGEALGSYYADRHQIEVVNFRIGWLLTSEELLEKQDASAEHARFARALWLSPRDCRAAIQRAVVAELPENPLTVHIISRNADRYVSLTPTMRALEFRPVDNSAEVMDMNDAPKYGRD